MNIPAKRHLRSRESILDFCNKINTSDDSFPAYIIRDKVEAIIRAETAKEMRELVYSLVDFLKLAIRRQDFKGIADYRNWKRGQIGLLGDRIDTCPVCGELGEIKLPYEEYNYLGGTLHVCRPFFTGVDILIFCDWKTGTREIYDPLLQGKLK